MAGRRRDAALGMALALLSMIALCSQAAAVTVETHKQGGSNEQGLLEVRDPAGESNELEIRIVGESADYLEFRVHDYVAPVTAGPGCEEADPATAICIVHKPGEGWRTALHLDLGDGVRNFLDATQLILHPDLPITAIGGTGEDVFATGGGNDVLDPGAGQNAMYGNPGDDEIIAPAAPDAGDLYDGGSGDGDRVSYARRAQPVHLFAGTVEATTGKDQMIGVEIVRGGEGDDTLDDGSPGIFSTTELVKLEGGAGDDLMAIEAAGGLLLGGPGNDTLTGHHLLGEDGDDVAYGSDGADLIELGAGDDNAYGGAGNDHLNGGPGEDLLVGGDGQDLVVGDGGFDRLFGARGADRIFAARWVTEDPHPLTSGSYDGRDWVGCGADRDRAYVNPWDHRQRCERVVEQPAQKRVRR
ncbi:MAG TPA: calcium-binding protein [Solirubrobacterales bacterium]|nr:calcium-binding protein [Solirubrobacterales bacterium]